LYLHKKTRFLISSKENYERSKRRVEQTTTKKNEFEKSDSDKKKSEKNEVYTQYINKNGYKLGTIQSKTRGFGAVNF
jgi:hypothetical protein